MANREHKAYPKSERPRTTRPKHGCAILGHHHIVRPCSVNSTVPRLNGYMRTTDKLKTRTSISASFISTTAFNGRRSNNSQSFRQRVGVSNGVGAKVAVNLIRRLIDLRAMTTGKPDFTKLSLG